MLNVILKINEEYFIWNRDMGCPVTNGMNKVDLKNWIAEQEKQDGIDSFDVRIKRVDDIGTSIPDFTPQVLTEGNKAGENGQELNLEEIFEKYNYKEKLNIKTIYNENIVSKEKLTTHNVKNKKQKLEPIYKEWIIGFKVIFFLILIVILSIFSLFVIDHPNVFNNYVIDILEKQPKVYFIGTIMFIFGLVLSSRLKIWFKIPKIINR